MRPIARLCWMLPVVAASPCLAQEIQSPGTFVPSHAVGYGAVGTPWTAVTPTTPLPVGAKQETVALVVANVPAPSATVYGGAYIVTQGCTGYGSVALRYRAPDGVTMTTLLTRTAADTMGGTLVSLGSNAVVDAAVIGTTGCNVTLARVPS